MASMTGENEQGLRKIIDLTRMISIVILVLHFYYNCYAAFREWSFTTNITDRILQNIGHSGLFKAFQTSKLIAIGLLTISLIGVRGRKSKRPNYKIAFAYIVIGISVYFA